MKTSREIFKEVVNELGFSDSLPSQMTNSDHWMCTCTAMERYAAQAIAEHDEIGGFNRSQMFILPINKEAIIKEHEQKQWKAYPENKPKANKVYIVTTKLNQVKAIYFGEKLWLNHSGIFEPGVIAFRELPTAYQREERSEG